MPPTADEPQPVTDTTSHGTLDPRELQRAWRLVRLAGECFDRVARLQGWPVPFGPIRYLLLAHLAEATDYGLSVRRLRTAVCVRRSTLAYHLDALEKAGLISRTPWSIHDRRKVAVRLTGAGHYAVRRLSIISPAIARP